MGARTAGGAWRVEFKEATHSCGRFASPQQSENKKPGEGKRKRASLQKKKAQPKYLIRLIQLMKLIKLIKKAQPKYLIKLNT